MLESAEWHGGLRDRQLAPSALQRATVDAALWSATRPGATFGEIFDEARQAYEQTGYADQWRFHHQGGSIGYQPRDAKAAPGDATTRPKRAKH